MKKNMFNHKLQTTSFFALVCLGIILMFSSCEKEETGNGDTTPPAQATNVTFEPNNGGGTFFYTVPETEDILFVKAVYELDNNETIFKASSFYADSLVIEGLGSIKEYTVNLVSVDRTGNESAPVVQKVTPLTPTTDLILSNLKVIPSFSSAFLTWENPQRKNIIIGVTYETQGVTLVRKYSSNLLSDNLLIEDLDSSISYDFRVDVEDEFDNVSSPKVFNDISPLGDVEIDKSMFTFLRDEFLPDSMNETWIELDEQGQEVTLTRTLTRAEKEGGYKGEDGTEANWNAKERNLDGNIQNFFDGIIDDGVLRNKNFFSTGRNGSFPFSYYIDMGQEIEMSRFRVWQRDWDWAATGADQSGYAYTTENVEIFELWISNDKENWERVSTARIVKPFDEIEAQEQARAGHPFIAYPEAPRFTKTFRYLEYRGLKRFDAVSGIANASEISIFGNPK